MQTTKILVSKDSDRETMVGKLGKSVLIGGPECCFTSCTRCKIDQAQGASYDRILGLAANVR
jgi:hypothetical protein